MRYDNEINLEYGTFLNLFLENDYTFIFFNELTSANNQIILRHDIDFDCELAYLMAKIESDINIKSTFFFLVSSDSYNIISESNYNYIKKIKDLGHQISIHFDPLVYNDYRNGLDKEVEIFQKIFGQDVEIISLHRPNQFFLESNEPISGIAHTYQDKYFKNIKYFADSTGLWRFGNPLNSREFKERMSLQVLVHPVWWITKGANNKTKIKTNYLKKLEEIKNHYIKNCKSFSEVSDEN
ncbi:hypothetical protein N9R54_02305 [Pelobium sp.]|nr:hypothetical protein [Pelobium sp.]MDA9555045.1 hypothetical protein [Pelobium sp.]